MFKVIEIDKIKSGKNIRNEMDDGINELMQSIQANGLINPILVKRIAGGKYEVIAGHRRFEAVKRLLQDFIECNIAEDEILQNQFTAYVSLAIRRQRIHYIKKKKRLSDTEMLFSPLHTSMPSEDDPFEKLLEYDALMNALRQIREKEREIVLARVIEEKPFTEIAQEMGMTYKAVTQLYYRIMKRLKAYMEGVDNG